MSLAEKPTDPSDLSTTLIEKLLKLPKLELARTLASLPPNVIESALRGEAVAGESASATEGGLIARAERRRTFQIAKAVFNNRMSVVDCTIRNRSDHGFLIEAKNALSIPCYFELHATMTDERFPIRVVWRNGAQLGLVVDN